MKKLTNYTPGLRGVTMKDDSVVWIKPGETVSVDADEIAAMPDLGDKPKAERDADDEAVADLKGQVADLTKQVEALTGENKALAKEKADLTKQVETLTKPAK